jgi:membrane-bound lytic murein transglycosylase A
MKSIAPLALALAGAILVAGCPSNPPGVDALEKNYEQQLPKGKLALAPVTDPAQIPDFSQACANTAGLREAVLASIDYLEGHKASSSRFFPYGTITHEQAVASLRAFLELLDQKLPPQQMNEQIRKRFDVYTSVGCDYRGTVLFTGYYTPVFEASATRTDRFKYPLYRPPPGLVKDPLTGNPTTPLPDRKTIESSAMYAGNEIAFLADAFEAYVAQVQGSVRLKMTDGSEKTIGYAASNGLDYRRIRDDMVADGKIAKYAGLAAMLDYFRRNPGDVSRYTWRNPRYIFFAEIPDGQPRGSLGQPVTPWRTIATDKDIFPRACLAFVSCETMPKGAGEQKAPYKGFALDQDTGNAIRAAGRCDIYMGMGPSAQQLAGRTQEEGRLYYLFLKPQALPKGALAPASGSGVTINP